MTSLLNPGKRRKPTQYSGLGEWLKPTDFDSVEETPRQFESDSRCGIIWEPSRGDTVFTNPKAKLIIIGGTDNGGNMTNFLSVLIRKICQNSEADVLSLWMV